MIPETGQLISACICTAYLWEHDVITQTVHSPMLYPFLDVLTPAEAVENAQGTIHRGTNR